MSGERRNVWHPWFVAAEQRSQWHTRQATMKGDVSMTIRLTCSCGRRMQFRDESAGRKSQCKGCGKTVRIPNVPRSADRDDFSSLLNAAIKDTRSAEAVDLQREAAQRAVSGEFIGRPAPCPFCGQPISRSAEACRHCQRSLRVGHCACCGAESDLRKKPSDGRKKASCRCNVSVVVWGDGEFDGLCTNCGRTLKDCRPWGSTAFNGIFASPEAMFRPCPCCAVDQLLDAEIKPVRNELDPLLALPGADGAKPRRKKTRSDEWRLEKLSQLISDLGKKVNAAHGAARAEKGVGTGLVKGIIGASLLGPIGIGLAAMSEQGREARIAEETGLIALSEKLQTAVRLRSALCKALEIDDAQAKALARSEAVLKGCGIGCLGIVLITILVVVVGNAVSYWFR